MHSKVSKIVSLLKVCGGDSPPSSASVQEWLACSPEEIEEARSKLEREPWYLLASVWTGVVVVFVGWFVGQGGGYIPSWLQLSAGGWAVLAAALALALSVKVDIRDSRHELRGTLMPLADEHEYRRALQLVEASSEAAHYRDQVCASGRVLLRIDLLLMDSLVAQEKTQKHNSEVRKMHCLLHKEPSIKRG